MDVSLYRFNLPPLKTLRVINSEIRGAVIKVMGSIKVEKEPLSESLPPSLLLHAQCCMKGKHCFKCAARAASCILAFHGPFMATSPINFNG